MGVPVIALAGATIHTHPRSRPLANGVLTIAGKDIAAVGTMDTVEIPANARVIDCAGATITTGFWNSHIHLTERKWTDAAEIPAAELQLQLHDFTRYGFTSIFDLSSLHRNTQAIRRRIDAGEVDGPLILSTGQGILPMGAAPPDIASRMMGWMNVPLHEIETPAQAAAAARGLLSEGADGIKIFASGLPSTRACDFSEDAMRAVVEIAHRATRLVFVHPNTSDDICRALKAGVDVVAHTVARSTSWEDAFASMTEARIALIPTLALWKHLMRHDRAASQKHAIHSAVEQLSFFHRAGGSILFGTDFGVVDPDPTDEYVLMSEAGMAFDDILASLTTTPSGRFGRFGDGVIAPGNPADVVVLNGGPSDGPKIFSDVRLTIRAGRIIYSSASRNT